MTYIRFFRGSKRTIRVEGEVSCVVAENQVALDKMYEVVNKEVGKVIAHLLKRTDTPRCIAGASFYPFSDAAFSDS